MTHLAKKLPASHRILLIDPSPIAYWPIASLRASVVPGWESKVYHTIDEASIFKSGSASRVIRARVTSINLEGNYVTLSAPFEGSDRVSFDALTLATGASQPFPMRPEDGFDAKAVEAAFKRTQKEVADAQHVLVIGGGPTGIEMAGEIRAQYPSKKITLVTRNKTLLDSRTPAKLAAQLESKLRALDVDVILGDEHVGNPHFGAGSQVVGTKGGKRIEADFVFLAVGNKPRSDLIAKALPSAVTDGGLVRVNDQLQVQGTSNVFAIGDVSDAPGWRSVVNAEAEAASAAGNMAAIAAKTSGGKLAKHKPGMRVMVVPLGPKNGSGFMEMPLLGEVLMPQFMVAAAKGKGLFVDKFQGRFVPV